MVAKRCPAYYDFTLSITVKQALSNGYNRTIFKLIKV